MGLMKVAIVGSRSYQAASKVRDFIFQLKKKFGDDLVIISGGAKEGADRFAKKFALQFDVTYKEYNPAHTDYNLYSAMRKDYYNKPYHASQFHHRNMMIGNTCNVMVAFCPDGVVTKGTASAIKAAVRKKKPVTVIK